MMGISGGFIFPAVFYFVRRADGVCTSELQGSSAVHWDSTKTAISSELF